MVGKLQIARRRLISVTDEFPHVRDFVTPIALALSLLHPSRIIYNQTPAAMTSLRILVPIKRVLDYAIKPRINAARNAVDLTGQKMSLNPFDELSIEASVRLREAHTTRISDILAFSAGPAKSQDSLRTAMAMGADRGLLVDTGATELEPLAVAKILKQVVEKENINLVILGKQSIDDDAGQTGQMLAGLLGWGQATQAAELHLEGDKIRVVKEVDGGTETVSGSLPMVVTTDLRLNEPRYASLPNIMKAKKKKLEKVDLASYGAGLEARLQVLEVVGKYGAGTREVRGEG